jgi:hypothetical protein
VALFGASSLSLQRRALYLSTPASKACMHDVLQAMEGKGSLTRCTLRKCAASPPGHMAPERAGVVQVVGPVNVNLQHCYVEVGGWEACEGSIS